VSDQCDGEIARLRAELDKERAAHAADKAVPLYDRNQELKAELKQVKAHLYAMSRAVEERDSQIHDLVAELRSRGDTR
jgi:predicted  nucleic acid-binding Zn-ribbon protein